MRPRKSRGVIHELKAVVKVKWFCTSIDACQLGIFNTGDVESESQNTLPINDVLGMLTKAKYLYIHQID